MEGNEKNILKEYEELTEQEKMIVDSRVQSYKDDITNIGTYNIKHTDYDESGNEHTFSYNVNYGTPVTSNDIEKFMAGRAEHIAKINERLDTNYKKDKMSDIRKKPLEDRNTQENSNAANDSDVISLKSEVASLKDDIKELKMLLKEKLK